MKGPLPHLRDDGGFTLLEMLVATTLLGLLSLVLYGALQFGLRSWQRTEEVSVLANTVRQVQGLLTADLTRAYPEVIRTNPTRMPVDFEGTRSRIRYLTASSRVAGALDHVTIGVPMGSKVLTRIAALELGAGSRVDSKVLLKHVEGFEISYFGAAEEDKTPRWQDTWHDRESMPLLVRIRARLAGGETWPDLVVAPAITADATCNFDPLTKNCRAP